MAVGSYLPIFTLPVITNKFQSVHTRDFLLLPLVLVFGFAIDGLYGIGHFLSFGISSIVAIQFVVPTKFTMNTKIKYIFRGLIILVFAWHGVIKFSIWQGLKQFENHQYSSAIPHLERAVIMYPKPIGRFHLILAEMYLENGEIENAQGHALKAQAINPKHEVPKKLLKKVEKLY